ncbi:hypothetical protein [Vandammella animalimorsus]|uniref:hypothetical protein n=1 Tax=Vandammella animalimorsus TaxID=2029117 RepID=UPI001178A2F5|nr:hypothetical protein [Vandammella animalimorsus]
MINRRSFLSSSAIFLFAAPKIAAASSHQSMSLSSLLKEIDSLRIKEGKFVNAFKNTKNGGIEWAASSQALLSISQIIINDDTDGILIPYLTKLLENINNHLFTPDIKFTANSYQKEEQSKNKIAATGAFLSLIGKIKEKDSNQRWLRENISKIINYAYFNSFEDQAQSPQKSPKNITNPEILEDLEGYIYLYNGLKDIEKKLIDNGFKEEAHFISRKTPDYEKKINQLIIDSNYKDPSALYAESLSIESLSHHAEEIWKYNKNRILNSTDSTEFPTKYLALSASIATQRRAHLVTERCLSLLSRQRQEINCTLPIDIIALLAVSAYHSGGILH